MKIEDRMSMWAAKRPRDEVAELLLEGAQEIADLRRHREDDGEQTNLDQGLRDGIERLRNGALEATVSQDGDCPDQDNVAKPDNVRRQGGKVGSKLAQDATGALTDEEREAIEVAAEAYAEDHGERFAATLWGLLERMA